MEKLVQKFLYYPQTLAQNAPLPSYAADAQEAFIYSARGDLIHGLYWPAPEGRPTILFFHGNAQTVFEWALIREEFAAMECGLLLIDYHGYGKSSGRPYESALYAAGREAYDWLVKHVELEESQILVFGKSLGGGVTCEIVQDKKPLGVILESTFRSIPSVARRLIPLLPAESIIKSEVYDSISKIVNIQVPVLVVHGTNDELIPFSEGQALFEAANEPKEFYEVPGAGHNDVSMIAGAAYGLRLRQWLDGLA